MPGTMYGDFSRSPDLRVGRFGAALMQQGRVQLDADWNAQVELSRHLTAQLISDLVGGSGTPRSAPGFGVYPMWALRFNGQDDSAFVISTPASLRRARERTIELWLTWDGGAGPILDCAGADGQFVYQLRIDRAGNLSCEYAVGSGDRVLATGAEPLQKHVPTRVALVLGEDYVSIYAGDSQLVRSSTGVVSHVPERLGVGAIGASEGSAFSGSVFSGTVAGLRVRTSALTPAQLADTAAPWPDAPAPDVAGAWLLHGQSPTGEVSAPDEAVLIGSRPPAQILAGLDIGPGRYYLAGMICEQLGWSRYTGEAPADPLPTSGFHVAYLEAWEETLDTVQAPALREVALGGYDTTVRLNVRSRVRTARIPFRERVAGERPTAGAVDAAIAAATMRTSGRLVAEHTGDPMPGNYLYRVEIHAGGALSRHGDSSRVEETAITVVDLEAGELVLEETWTGPTGGAVEVVALDADGTSVIVVLDVESLQYEPGRTRIRVAGSLDLLTGLQRRRVRRSVRPATFKWSRRNGSDVFAIEPARRGAESVQLVGRPQNIGPLIPGNLVEVLDDPSPLTSVATPLLTVLDVSASGEVWLGEPLSAAVGQAPGARPYLRRWDHVGSGERDGALPVSGGWTALEHGIRVRFEPGCAYARGDYWWIVAREDLGSIEWPRLGGAPEWRGPDGVDVSTAPLALLCLDRRPEVIDLRRTFGPVAAVSDELGAAVAQPVATPPDWPYEPGAGFEVGVEVDDERSREDPGELEETEPDETGEGEAEPFTSAPGRIGGGWEVGSPAGLVQPGLGWDLPAAALPAEGADADGSAGWELVGLFDVGRAELSALTSYGEHLVATLGDGVWTLHPGRGSAERIAALPDGRAGFIVAQVDELLLLFGGRQGTATTRTLHALDLERREWSERSRLPRGHVTALAAAGRQVHVVSRTGVSRRHFVYDVAADTWSPAAHRGHTLSAERLVAVEHRLHAVSGANHLLYDRRDGAIRRASKWSDPRPVVDATAHRGRPVVLVHARGASEPPGLLSWDSRTEGWSRLDDPPEPLEHPRLAVHADRLMLAGRRADGVLAVYRRSEPR